MTKETLRYLVLAYHKWEDVQYSLDGESALPEKVAVYANKTKDNMNLCEGYCLVFASLEEAKKHYPEATILTISCKD
jgi:hypothetical protein